MQSAFGNSNITAACWALVALPASDSPEATWRAHTRPCQFARKVNYVCQALAFLKSNCWECFSGQLKTSCPNGSNFGVGQNANYAKACSFPSHGDLSGDSFTDKPLSHAKRVFLEWNGNKDGNFRVRRNCRNGNCRTGIIADFHNLTGS